MPPPSNRPGKMSSTLSKIPRRFSGKPDHTDTLVTLFKRDSLTETFEEDSDTISMSHAGQKVIPATFNLVPIQPKPCNSSSADFEQAGGHDGSFHIEGKILVKKVEQREASFYKRAQNGEWPTQLIPNFYGTTDDGTAIRIENLTYNFDRPCVIDLKMGIQTVDDDESRWLKKIKMNALDRVTGTKNNGCRLEGLSMYRTLENKRVKGTKAQSHSISARMRVSLQDVLTFFLTDESGVRSDVALRFQLAIENILTHFKKNKQFRFIGSSILLIYDNDNRAPYMHWARALRKLHTINPKARLSEDQISGLTRQTRCDVRMIDFAHTGPMPKEMTLDHGYITGLESILTALKAIRVYREKPIFSMVNAVVDAMEEKRSSRGAAASAGEEFTFSSLLSELTPMALDRDGVRSSDVGSNGSGSGASQ